MKRSTFGILLVLVCACIFTTFAFAAEEGMTFEPYGIYKTAEPLEEIPATYEAWIKVPEGNTYNIGAILSNSHSSHYSSFGWYAYENGAPMLKFLNKTPDGEYRTQKSYTFGDVNLATGKWIHLALVHDTAKGYFYCYINGDLAQSIKISFTPELSPMPLVLGGSHISGNDYYFKGYIRSATLYADVRSADEIKADMLSVDVSDENLMVHYDLTDAEWGKDIKDAAENHDMLYNPYWYDEAPAVPDYAYSMAVVGDQQVVIYRHPELLHFTYDWILNNKDEKKISYVINVGDYTQTTSGKVSEYDNAIAQFKRITEKLPLLVVKGNHEVVDMHNKYMNYPAYTSDIIGQYKDGDLVTLYKTAKICNTDYLFITMDWGPTEEEIAWATDVVLAHPNHKVIVATHGFMTDDGTLLDENDSASPTTHDRPNNGKTLWDKFVSKHENIIMVFSGHIDSDEVRAVKLVGDHGNVVTSIMIDQQGIDRTAPSGLVLMLYFNEDGNVVHTQYYSTIRRQYFRIDENHYTTYIGERSGDCNGDGVITLADVMATISAFFGGEAQKNADVNGDGKITVKDALLIMRMAAKGE